MRSTPGWGDAMSDNPAMRKFRQQTAKRLRANAIQGERRFWRMLRSFPVFGSHFRRQVAIGPYVADFACMAARLVIEIDGAQHALPQQSKKDAARTAWFSGEGYRVLRFWNNELIENPDGVLESIFAALHGSATAESAPLTHHRRSKRRLITPPRRALRADPSPPGEGDRARSNPWQTTRKF